MQISMTIRARLTLLSVLAVLATSLLIGLFFLSNRANEKALAEVFEENSQSLVRDVVSGVFFLAEDAFRILNAVCTQQVEGVATTFGCCFSKAIKPGGGSDTKGIPAWQVGSAEECKQAARFGELFVGILYVPGVEQLWVRLHQLGHPRDFERGSGKRCVSSIEFASVHRTDRVRTGPGKGAPVS